MKFPHMLLNKDTVHSYKKNLNWKYITLNDKLLHKEAFDLLSLSDERTVELVNRMEEDQVFNKIIFAKYFARNYCLEYIDFVQNQVHQKLREVSSWSKGYLTLDELVPRYL